MVVLVGVKILAVSGIQLGVVLRALNVEVSDPTELTINVPLFGQFRVVRHTGSLNLVLLIWVKLTLRMVHNALS